MAIILIILRPQSSVWNAVHLTPILGKALLEAMWCKDVLQGW